MITDSDRSEMEMMRLDLEIEMKEENEREANKKKNPRKSIPNEIFFFFLFWVWKSFGALGFIVKEGKRLGKKSFCVSLWNEIFLFLAVAFTFAFA